MTERGEKQNQRCVIKHDVTVRESALSPETRMSQDQKKIAMSGTANYHPTTKWRFVQYHYPDSVNNHDMCLMESYVNEDDANPIYQIRNFSFDFFHSAVQTQGQYIPLTPTIPSSAHTTTGPVNTLYSQNPALYHISNAHALYSHAMKASVERVNIGRYVSLESTWSDAWESSLGKTDPLYFQNKPFSSHRHLSTVIKKMCVSDNSFQGIHLFSKTKMLYHPPVSLLGNVKKPICPFVLPSYKFTASLDNICWDGAYYIDQSTEYKFSYIPSFNVDIELQ